MGKLLLIDDTGGPSPVPKFRDYQPLFRGDEVHLAFYRDTFGDSMGDDYIEGRIFGPLRDAFGLKSAVAYTHPELVAYLRSHGAEFDRIVLDGLEDRCFTLIDEVPLTGDKATVVSASPRVLHECDFRGFPHLDKDELKPAD